MSQQAFLQAVTSGDTNEVRRLLAVDSTLADACNEQGVSALLLACYYQKPDCVSALRAERKVLKLCEAAAVGSVQDALTALESEPITTRSADGFSALHLAAYFGNTDVAQALLARGAEVNVESDNAARLAPLNSAAACQNASSAVAICSMLLEHGADPHHAQNGGHTPLHSAAANGNSKLVQALLKSGANPLTKSTDGRTASDMADERGHAEVASLLRGIG